MRSPFKLAFVATLLFCAALLLARLGVPDYSHRLHPVALRGAAGFPGALWFNAFAFVLPGMALALAGQRLRAALQAAGWATRIGIVLTQLSALAFAGMGVLPLDASDFDASASRLHALMWMLWWIAFVPGALLLAAGQWRRPLLALICVTAGILLPVIALLAPIGLWVGLVQRMADGIWFGWWLAVCGWFSRTSTSGAKLCPPAQT